MNIRLAVAASVVALAVVACSSQESSPDAIGAWVGSISTEGNVTIVVNESGSVWGGTATLVEEASIGVESGVDEYMFGEVIDLYADDGAIYVVDRQVPAVRAYDHEGRHLRDFGGPGQGPGEYTRPSTVWTTPAGEVLVLDDGTRRINVYAPDGQPRDDVYPLATGLFCCPVPWFVDAEGAVWIGHVDWDPRGSVFGYTGTLREYGPDGATGRVREVPSIEFEAAAVLGDDGRPHTLPDSPQFVWSVSPSGRLIVGASDRYRFEIHDLDGSVTHVERSWERTPLSDEEVDWRRRFQIAVNRAPAGWDGAELPRHMPAFMRFIAARTGEIWVSRPGPNRRLQDCADPSGGLEELMSRGPCWERTRTYEVFGPDGRFLGPVDLPDELRRLDQIAPPWIAGDRFIAAFSDEAGTIMVKRYRLVLPGEDP